MEAATHCAAPSALARSLVRALVGINAGAAALLLTALLVAGLWQNAATDFVWYIAAGLAMHGLGLLAGVCVYAFLHLRSTSRRPVPARVFAALSIIACAISAACLATGLALLVWGGMNVLGASGDYDTESHSTPLGWSRS